MWLSSKFVLINTSVSHYETNGNKLWRAPLNYIVLYLTPKKKKGEPQKRVSQVSLSTPLFVIKYFLGLVEAKRIILTLASTSLD